MLEIDGLEVAGTRRARGRGLLGRDGIDGALWLPGVRSIHTVGMRFALDVAWLAGDGRVLRVRTLAPGRVTGWWPARRGVSRVGQANRAAGVLEAEAGAFARWGLAVGSTVDLRASAAHRSHDAHEARGVDRVNGDGGRPGRDRHRRA